MGEQDTAHVSEHDLLLFLDGEVDKSQEASIHQHLAACWSCRARRDDLQSTITTVVRALDDVVLPHVPPPPSAWEGLEPRLARLDEQLKTRQRLTRWRMGAWGVVRTVRLRWAAAAALVAVVSSLVIFQQRTVTAEELLAGARRVEQLDVHRQLALEERSTATGDLVTRHRVDIWQSATTGERARRLYNERSELVAGEWTHADGTRTLYRRGQSPRVEDGHDVVSVTPDNVWRLELAASMFAAIAGDLSRASVDHRAGTFVLSSPMEATDGSAPGVNVSLVLGEGALHPLQLSVTFTEDSRARTLQLVEHAFAETSRANFPVAALSPEPELTAGPIDAPASAPTPPAAARRLDPEALVGLQVDALVRLDRVGALLGEQIDVGSTPNGLLRIEAFVDSEARKTELTRALEPLAPSWAVRTDIQTFAEAQRRAPSPQAPSSTVRSVDITSTRAAAYEDLRRFIVERLPRDEASDAPAIDAGGQVERQIQQLTGRVLERSLQARLHARALAQIISRVSERDLQTMTPDRRRDWRGVVHDHAAAFRRETEALRRELQPIFFPTPPDPQRGRPGDHNALDTWQAASTLFELATAHDITVGQAFAVSARESSSARLRSTEFWHSLIAAEALAADLQNTCAAGVEQP